MKKVCKTDGEVQKDMSLTFTQMQEMYMDVVGRFNPLELGDWKPEEAVIELSNYVGELAKKIIIREKYYKLTGKVTTEDEYLGDGMVEVISQLMRLADYYDVDLEKKFIEARVDDDKYLQSRGI